MKHLPENLQLKILSLVAGSMPTGQPSQAGVAASKPTKRAALPTHDDGYHAWARGLASRYLAHGYAWQDEMVPESLARPLLRSAQALPDVALAPAGMGASVLRWRDNGARGDSIAWVPLEPPTRSAPSTAPTAPPSPPSALDGLQSTAGWAHLRSALTHIVDALNSDAAESDGEWAEVLHVPEKVMLARYPAGARYVRHSDVSPAVAHRRATAIVYLNEAWQPSDGGELMLYPCVAGTAAPTAALGEGQELSPVAAARGPGEGTERQVRVAPVMGRLALFRSSIEHEVNTTNATRWAVTAWLSVAKAAVPPPPSVAPALPQDAASSAILQLAAAMAGRGQNAAEHTGTPAALPAATQTSPAAPSAATSPPPAASLLLLLLLLLRLPPLPPPRPCRPRLPLLTSPRCLSPWRAIATQRRHTRCAASLQTRTTRRAWSSASASSATPTPTPTAST